MNFTLFYLGRIPSANSSTLKKIEVIRHELSPQIRNIYNHAPLKDYPITLEPNNEEGLVTVDSESTTQIEVEVIPVREMFDTIGLFGLPVF